jgi:DNA-binding GntR family transcriptional regulator
MTTLFHAPDSQEQLRAYLEQDHAFHRGIIALTGNGTLTELYEQVNTHLLIARITSFYTRAHLVVTHQEHEAIMAALVARDPMALADSLERHATHSGQAALENLARAGKQWNDVESAS